MLVASSEKHQESRMRNIFAKLMRNVAADNHASAKAVMSIERYLIFFRNQSPASVFGVSC